MSDTILNKSIIYNILYKRFNNNFLTLKDLPNPYQFKDMKKSVKRVVKAIENREKIVVIGDYDVDGVVATTVLRELFSSINFT